MDHPLGWNLVKIMDNNNVVQGGGFFFAPNTICTCFHVVFGEDYSLSDSEIVATIVRYEFVSAPGWPGNARPRRWSKPRGFSGDVLFLTIEGPLPNRIQRNHLYDVTPSSHSPAEICGFPAGFPMGVWAEGYVGQATGSGWRSFTSREQFGTPLQRGFSGSPVWDITRQVIIGMVVGVIRDPAQRVGFIIPNQLIATLDPSVTLKDPSTQYFGRQRSNQFTAAARATNAPEEIIDYLADLAIAIEDPTQRYWVYAAIADIAGPRAIATLRRMKLAEKDLFATKAICDGLSILT